MKSPFDGDFEVTQEYKGDNHDGLDLVGLDSPEVHATVTGDVVYAAWENPADKNQGFGQYVVIKSDADGLLYHYGHLKEIRCKVGDKVHCTDVIGIMGSTGHSTGPHTHYCVRRTLSCGSHVDVTAISGIPNKLGVYNDGYAAKKAAASAAKVIDAILEIEGHKYSGILTEYI